MCVCVTLAAVVSAAPTAPQCDICRCSHSVTQLCVALLLCNCRSVVRWLSRLAERRPVPACLPASLARSLAMSTSYVISHTLPLTCEWCVWTPLNCTADVPQQVLQPTTEHLRPPVQRHFTLLFVLWAKLIHRPNGISIGSFVFVCVPNAMLDYALSTGKNPPPKLPLSLGFRHPARRGPNHGQRQHAQRSRVWFQRYPRGQTDRQTLEVDGHWRVMISCWTRWAVAHGVSFDARRTCRLPWGRWLLMTDRQTDKRSAKPQRIIHN